MVNVARGLGCLHAALGMDPGERGTDPTSLPQPHPSAAHYGHQRALLANSGIFLNCCFPWQRLTPGDLLQSKPEGAQLTAEPRKGPLSTCKVMRAPEIKVQMPGHPALHWI